jgi:hypothetical protein
MAISIPKRILSIPLTTSYVDVYTVPADYYLEIEQIHLVNRTTAGTIDIRIYCPESSQYLDFFAATVMQGSTIIQSAGYRFNPLDKISAKMTTCTDAILHLFGVLEYTK